MDVLVAGQRVELLDPRLHVVAGDPLAGGDRVEVDLVDDVLVGGSTTPSGTSMPRSRCASSTAIHSRRSSTILCSGDQIAARSAPGVPGGEHVRDGHSRASWSMPRGRITIGRDVGAVLGALEFYARDTGVRRRASGREIGAGADDGEHPATGGDQVVRPCRGGAGVDDVHAVERLGRVDTGDRRRPSRPTRGSRRWPAPPPTADAVAPAAAAARRRACRWRRRAAAAPAATSSRASSGWVSGSPKRALNSTTRTPLRGQRQPGVEQAGERRAAAGHLVDGRLQHRRAAPRRPGRPAPRAAACRRPCRRCWVPRRRRRSA